MTGGFIPPVFLCSALGMRFLPGHAWKAFFRFRLGDAFRFAVGSSSAKAAPWFASPF
jgi:hypothetical protein